MAATLDIREIPKGLVIRVTEPRNLKNTLIGLVLSALACGLFLYFVHLSQPTIIFVGVLVSLNIIHQAVSKLRGTSVTLEVTNLDLISKGHAPNGYSSSSIPRAVIYGLRFKEGLEGEDESLPGLYVEHHGVLYHPQTCVLPHIDKTQTKQAIDVIMRRFPDTCALPPTGVFEPYLTSLHLNK